MVKDGEQMCLVTASKCGPEEGDISVNYECLQNGSVEELNENVCFLMRIIHFVLTCSIRMLIIPGQIMINRMCMTNCKFYAVKGQCFPNHT